jgi:ActR/RegA family two-component response regulator
MGKGREGSNMTPASESAETVLIVDDEEPVRRTFREWLEGARLGCRILTAGDAATALQLADRQPIDLAILDWNLGAGNDGLQLLEDLVVFSPDVVAIMVTGFANQATPLMAMRMGVRDYLDKNQDLDRTTFLNAVKRQLDRIRPARRERRIHQGLAAFRDAVGKVLPLVQAAAALNDPVPLPAAVRGLFGFLLTATSAREGVFLVHSYDTSRQPPEVYRAYDAQGEELPGPLVPFARSLAGSVLSLQQAHTMDRLDRAAGEGTLELQPFERGRRNVLAAPLDVAPGVQVVLELFDKHDTSGTLVPFTDADRQLVRASVAFAAELLRQALAERHTHRVLFDAVGAALRAGDEVGEALHLPATASPSDPPPREVLEQLHAGLEAGAAGAIDAASTLRLAEAIRVLALRYGSRAVQHCTQLVEDLRRLLDEVAGAGEEGHP